MTKHLTMDDMPKLRKRGRPRKPTDPNKPRAKTGRKPLAVEEKRRRMPITLPPELYDAVIKESSRRLTEQRYCSRAKLVEVALLEYLGLRQRRDAEILLNRFGQRAARVLSLTVNRGGMQGQVYQVLYDLTKAVGEDWQDDNFDPAPDELTELRAQNAQMRKEIKRLHRTDDAGVDAWLNQQPEAYHADDIRDGTIAKPKKYLQPVAEPEPAEDDEPDEDSPLLGAMLRGGSTFLG